MGDYVRATRNSLAKVDNRRVAIRRGDIAHKNHAVVAASRPDVWGPMVADFDVPKQEAKSEPVKRGPGRPRKA